MICNKCFNVLEEGVKFCPLCGTRVADIIESEKKSSAVNDVFGGNDAIPTDNIESDYTHGQQIPVEDTVRQEPRQTTSYTYTPTYTQEAKPLPEPKEKEFFGKGAFILCLIIIALLSASTGMFAYMYFSLIGAI